MTEVNGLPSAVSIFDMRLTDKLRLACTLVVAALAGCASVTTRITVLEPAQQYAPTQNVAVLLEPPVQPHSKIALIEAQGTVGGGEAELFEEARRKAQALGADAIVRLEVISVYQPPVQVYDPWYGNPFYPRYRNPYRPFGYSPFAYSPFAYGPFPYSEYRWVAGGDVKTLKAVAIKYAASDAGTLPAP